MRTLELVRSIDRSAIRSIFVTLSGRPGILASEFEAAGAEIAPMRLSPAFPMAFIRLLRRNEVDAVHSHVALFSGAITMFARLAGVPRRIAHFRSDSPPGRLGVAKHLEYWLLRNLVDKTATDIVGVSPGSLTYGWRADWEKDPRCEVIPSGLDLTRFDDLKEVDRLRTLVGAAPGDKMIIHVGRGVPLKNRERAIALLAELSHDRSHPWLAFVGADSPEDRARWQEQARDAGVADHVRFLGDRGDVPQLLVGADLLLLTSHYEGLPGVLVEAAAAGTPSLASDLPGSRFLAERLSDVHPVSLDDTDAEWARQAAVLLELELTSSAREAALRRMRGSIFDLVRAVPRFVALWTGVESRQEQM